MRTLCPLIVCALNLAAAAAPAPRLDGRTPAERGDALVACVATCKPSAKDESYPKASAPAYAARLLRGVETAYALEKLDASVACRIARDKTGPPGNPLSPPGLDPFDRVALVNTKFLCKAQIPAVTAPLRPQGMARIWRDELPPDDGRRRLPRRGGMARPQGRRRARCHCHPQGHRRAPLRLPDVGRGRD